MHHDLVYNRIVLYIKFGLRTFNHQIIQRRSFKHNGGEWQAEKATDLHFKWLIFSDLLQRKQDANFGWKSSKVNDWSLTSSFILVIWDSLTFFSKLAKFTLLLNVLFEKVVPLSKRKFLERPRCHYIFYPKTALYRILLNTPPKWL